MEYGRPLYFCPVVSSIFFLSSFFPRLISAVADWISAILTHMVWPKCEFRMQVWKVLHAARWRCRTQKIVKNSPSGHHRTTLSGCIFATKTCINNRKKNSLNSNICSTCPHNMANVSPQVYQFGAPQQISTGFKYWLRYCSNVAHLRPIKLCMMFGRLLGWYSMYIFSGVLDS